MTTTEPVSKPAVTQGDNDRPILHFYPHNSPDEALCGHRSTGKTLVPDVPHDRKCPVCLLLLRDILAHLAID